MISYALKNQALSCIFKAVLAHLPHSLYSAISN